MSSAPDTSPPPLPACPYPGLRPFRRDEDTLFFGRSTHVSHLLQHLGDHRFLAVLGASGSGKSSLVRAGLMPALQAGLAGEIGYEWCCVEFRPGDDPLQRLADVLAELDNSLDNPADAHDGHARLLDADREFHRTHLTRRQNPLEEFRNDSRLGPEVNLLLLVDQFEELFRFRDPLQAEAEEAEAGAAPPADGRPRLTRQERVDESEVFINLLLAALSHPRIYIVLTMRSEYLGDCAKFGGLTEAINQNHYLTPRLNREQMAEAIERPASQRGVSVEPELLNRLLNDAGANSDQLPLLQHTLSRMWRRLAGGTTTLTLAQYLDKPIETIARCLDAHATAIYESLTAEQQRIAARLFRSLTERGRHRRDTRRICTLGEIVDLIAADRARSAAAPDTPSTHAQLPSAPAPSRDEVRPEVLAVIEKFREAEAAMLMPEAGVPLHDESTLDITHESVIRQWSLLRTDWIAREAEAAEGYFEYSSQARKRMLPADAAQRTRKRFFLSWFSRMMLHQPRFIVGAKLRRQLQHAASAAREFTDHLDDFGLQTAIRWRDAGGTTQPFLESAAWKEQPPTEEKAAAPPDDMARSAVWALRYDKRAAQHFPLTLNYINESQVRRESERAERWMLLNVVKVLSVLSVLGIIAVCWVLDSLSKATEANFIAKTDADRRVEQALTEKRAADARVAEALAEKSAAATAADKAKELTKVAESNTETAKAKAAAATLEQKKADAAITEARTQQAVSDWGAGRMLNALAHLARTQPPGGDAPWQPALASELPPPVTFSHLITNSAPPLSMTLSPDGRWLAVRVENGVDLVDTHTGQLTGPPLELAKSYSREGICFVPGSNPGEWCLLHCSDGGLQIYQIPALALRAEAEPAWLKFLQAQEKHRWEAVILSGDGSRIAALGTEGEVALVSMSAPPAGFLWQPTQKAKAKPDFSSGCLIALDHEGRHLVVVTADGEVLVVEAGATAAQCRLLAKPYTPDRATGFPGAVQLAISPLTTTASTTKSRLRFTLADGEGRILPLSLERAAATKQKAGSAAELEYQLIVEAPPENPPQAVLNIAVQTGPVAGPALAANAPRPGPSYANQSVSQIRRTAATPGMEFPRSGLPLIWTGNDATLRCWWGHGWRAAEEQWPNFQLVEAHRGKVTGCTIATDASWAATCGEDGVTRFWRIMSGAERRRSVALQPAEWSAVRWRDGVPVAWGLDRGGLLKTFVAGEGFRWHPLRTFENLVDEPELPRISGDGSTALVLSLQGLDLTGIADLSHPLRRMPLEQGAPWHLSHSGRRMALLSPSGQIAVYDAASRARVPGFAAPEETAFSQIWFGAEDCLAAKTENGALLVLQEQGAPAMLLPPPPEEASRREFTIAAPAGGQHLLVVLALNESNKAAVHRSGRKDGAWPPPADGESVPIDLRMGYDGGEFQSSPDGEWIAWVDPEQRLRRMQFSLRREFPVTQPFPGKPASLAINNSGELLAAAGRELYRWDVPKEDRDPATATAPTPVPLAPECDWRLAAFKDSAQSMTGLHQDSTFVQAPDIVVPGTVAPLPGPAPAALVLWQAAIQSDRALADTLLAAPKVPVTVATLTGNADFPSLLRWLDAAAKDPDAAPLIPAALSRWDYLTELAGLPSVSLLEMLTGEGDTAALVEKALLELPLLREQRALEANARLGFGLALLKKPEARAHFTDPDLREMLKAAISSGMLSTAPLLMAEQEEPIFTALLPVLGGTGETWREPFLAALQHLPPRPNPDRPGPPHPPERWREAAGAATEAARRLQSVLPLDQSWLLQPVTLIAGRLARLAGLEDADAFLKAAAESTSLSAGHAEMKALALALTGDYDGATTLLQPLLAAEEKPGSRRRSGFAPEFLATVQLLHSRQLSRDGDPAKAAELKSTALAALRQSSTTDRGQFLKFFGATPEIWEHAREFRAPQSARPPGRMRR